MILDAENPIGAAFDAYKAEKPERFAKAQTVVTTGKGGSGTPPGTGKKAEGVLAILQEKHPNINFGNK